jgi:hypothetical protein
MTDTTDLIRRLREYADDMLCCKQAADAIETLVADLDVSSIIREAQEKRITELLALQEDLLADMARDRQRIETLLAERSALIERIGQMREDAVALTKRIERTMDRMRDAGEQR